MVKYFVSDPEDGGSMFLRNVAKHVADDIFQKTVIFVSIALKTSNIQDSIVISTGSLCVNYNTEFWFG
jgi:hypothetical protein